MEVETLEGPSTFLDIVGDSPRVRILDFLLGEIGHDYTLKEIASYSGVGYATIKRIWHQFVEAELVLPTRRVGKAFFYTFNTQSHSGKALRKFYLEVLVSGVEHEPGVDLLVEA